MTDKASIKGKLEALVQEEAEVQAPQAERRGPDPRLKAFIALAPSNAGRIVASAFNLLGSVGRSDDVQIELAKRFMESAEMVNLGDMSEVEAMLMNQAQALQTVFASLMHGAAAAKKVERHDALLQLALRAQANSRATLAALIDAKFPRQTVIARQANVNNGGQQQVNNGASSAERSTVPPATADSPRAALPHVEPLASVPFSGPNAHPLRARTRKSSAAPKK